MESTTKQERPPGRDLPHPCPTATAIHYAIEFGGLETGAAQLWLEDRTERAKAACAEIGRELAFRRVVYPRFVADGKLSQEKASRQVEALEDAAVLLRELLGMLR